MLSLFSAESQLRSARELVEKVADVVDLPLSVRLWDGSLVPLGRRVAPGCLIAVHSPDVVGSLLRRPTLDNVLAHYATGRLTLHGGTLIELGELARSAGHLDRSKRAALRRLFGRRQFRALLHLLFTRAKHDDDPKPVFPYKRDQPGRRGARREKAFVQFHYDIGNDFFQLFLDPEMQYSCAYFRDGVETLAKAQSAKLEYICRKLQLQPGERFLDIGCGWGGLLCHAASHYGVEAYGVTLSEQQHAFALDKICGLGLQDQVQIDLLDYASLNGRYDKIASIGMYEHIGISEHPAYFRKVRSLLRQDGLFLNQGITRRAKKNRRIFDRISPGRRWVLRYIFPGTELDHIGHTIEVMEACGLEVSDIEGLREHYSLTAREWCQRLEEREEEAVGLVGPERFRLWLAYLAGVSFSFGDGFLRVFQTLAARRPGPGPSALPRTREYLFR